MTPEFPTAEGSNMMPLNWNGRQAGDVALPSDSFSGTHVQPKESRQAPSFETFFGFFLAIFAALLAINDLGGGKYGDDEIKLTNERSGVYLWYQSKGIKESITEGQKNLLETLSVAGVIEGQKAEMISSLMSSLTTEISRYSKEKKEILLGSQAIKKEDWVQDVDGVLGKVVGAKELEGKIKVLGDAGERFDLANLFLQLSMVMGAIGILVKEHRLKWVFLTLLFMMGCIGTVFSFLAYRIAWTV